MLPKKETTMLYLLVIIASVVVVCSKNPSEKNVPTQWNKCSKTNRPKQPDAPHRFITDAIFRNKV